MANQNIIFAFVISFVVLVGGMNAYRQEQRIEGLQSQVIILRSYNVANLENRVKDLPGRYEVGQLAEKVDTKADSVQLSVVRNAVETVQTRVDRVVRPWPFEDTRGSGTFDSWNVFLSQARSAKSLQAQGDTATARALTIVAFDSIGVFCHPRRLPRDYVEELFPLVDDLFIFVQDLDRADWVVIHQIGGC